MLSRRAAVGLIGSLLTPVNVFATQIWPQRTIRVITPAQSGGSPDVVARLYADGLARKLGQAVVVENRPGADGILAIQALLEAASGDPNHVFLVAPTTISTVLPALKEKLPFDAAKDIQPLCTAAADFLAIAVPETSSLRSIADVVELSKRSPGTLNWFAVPGAPFLLMSHWVKALELPMVYVPYKGGPDAVRDLAENRIQILMAPLSPLMPLADAGKVRLLAVTNPVRSKRASNIPTVSEAGYPDLALEGVIAFFAPRHASQEARQRLTQAVQEAGAEPRIAEGLEKAGQVSRTSDSATLGAFLRDQRDRWTRLAREQGVRQE